MVWMAIGISADAELLLVEVWLRTNMDLVKPKVREIEEELQLLESNRSANYDRLKRRFRRVRQALEERQNYSNEDIQALVNLITSPQRGITQDFRRITGQSGEVSGKPIWRSIFDGAREIIGNVQNSEQSIGKLPELPFLNDQIFAADLDQLAKEQPVFSDAVKEIRAAMVAILEDKIKKLEGVPHHLGRMLQNQMDEEVNAAFGTRERAENKRAWDQLRLLVQSSLADQRRRDG